MGFNFEKDNHINSTICILLKFANLTSAAIDKCYCCIRIKINAIKCL